MATVRIYSVAELLGTTSQEVVALLKRDHGIEVKSASSTIEEVVARQFVERMARQRGVTLPSGDLFAETPAHKPKKAEGGRKTEPAKKPEPPKPIAPSLPPPRLVKTIRPKPAEDEAHVAEPPAETPEADAPEAAPVAAAEPPPPVVEKPAAPARLVPARTRLVVEETRPIEVSAVPTPAEPQARAKPAPPGARARGAGTRGAGGRDRPGSIAGCDCLPEARSSGGSRIEAAGRRAGRRQARDSGKPGSPAPRASSGSCEANGARPGGRARAADAAACSRGPTAGDAAGRPPRAAPDAAPRRRHTAAAGTSAHAEDRAAAGLQADRSAGRPDWPGRPAGGATGNAAAGCRRTSASGRGQAWHVSAAARFRSRGTQTTAFAAGSPGVSAAPGRPGAAARGQAVPAAAPDGRPAGCAHRSAP